VTGWLSGAFGRLGPRGRRQVAPPTSRHCPSRRTAPLPNSSACVVASRLYEFMKLRHRDGMFVQKERIDLGPEGRMGVAPEEAARPCLAGVPKPLLALALDPDFCGAARDVHHPFGCYHVGPGAAFGYRISTGARAVRSRGGRRFGLGWGWSPASAAACQVNQDEAREQEEFLTVGHGASESTEIGRHSLVEVGDRGRVCSGNAVRTGENRV